jgi:DNA replication protein DnaC
LTSTPIRCGFCGSELKPLYQTFEIANEHRDVFLGYAECPCPQAVAEREREEAERKAEEAAKAEAERMGRYEKAGIPPKYLTATADLSYGLPRVMAGRGLYIQGDNGTCKTTYASALAMKVIDLGKSVVFTSSSRMKGELFSTTRDNTEEDLFRKWSAPYLLVIDDLGKECANKAVVPMLYRVINERDEQMKPVVVTCNFDKATLGEKLSECGDVSCAKAIVSRLFGMTDKMVFGGGDRRLL